MIVDVWRGAWPPVDGGWTRVPPWHDGVCGVVAFSGHAAICPPDDFTDEQLDALGANGFGGAHNPRLITAMAGPNGWIDILDCVFAGAGTGAGSDLLVPRPDLAGHDRVVRAGWIRSDVKVFGLEEWDDVVVTIANGLGRLPEMSVELGGKARRIGLSDNVIRAALDLVPAGEPVLASVSPGNVASMRAFIRAGYEPVGSVQVFRPGGHPGDNRIH